MKETNDLLFLDEESSKHKVHVKDILSLILHNIHWFIICAAIGGLIAAYFVRKQDKIYSSSATIILKNINTQSGARLFNQSSALSGYSGSLGRFTSGSVRNEMLVIKSKTTMLKVVQRLRLNCSYFAQTKLVKRKMDLYGKSPVEVVFVDETENTNAQLTITPCIEDSTFIVKIDGINPMKCNYNKTIVSPIGYFIVRPTWYLTPDYDGVPIYFSQVPATSVADMYRGALNVSYDESTASVVTLSISNTSAKRAADILNTTIEVYNEDLVNDKKILLDYTSNYINERLELLGEDLGADQSQLARFKKNNIILNLDNYGEQYLERSIQSNAEVEQLRKQLSMAEYLNNQLLMNNEIKPIAASIEIEDGAVSSVIKEYNDLAFQLGKYENSGNTNNPAVKTLTGQIIVMKDNLITILSAYMETLNERISRARNQEMAANSKVQQVPESQIFLHNVERMQGVRDEIYKSLLTKREELMINQPTIEGSAKIVDEARAIEVPVAPNENKWITIGILLGLAFPCLIFWLIRILDTKVVNRSDVEDIVTVPFLGEIPLKSEDDTRHIVMEGSKRDVISEAFRGLRPNIDYIIGAQKPKVVLFTSFLEGSGKTFLSSNIATSYAMLDKKVALVDLDLRKGTMGKIDGKSRIDGVASYLSGKVDNLSAIAVPDEKYPGLHRFFAGPLPPNPAELLSSARMDALIDYLKKNYEYIFLDSVPAGMVADADIVKKYADNTLFVIRAGKFDKRMLPDLQQLYDNQSFPGMSIVMNGVDYSARKGYGYGSRIGYGYGYGYGYGHYGYGYGGYGYGADYGTDSDAKKEHSVHKHRNALHRILKFFKH